MEYKITGDNLQIVTLEIDRNELVYAEAGALVYMSGNIDMEAKARGGLWKGIKRKFMGETFFLTEFRTRGGSGLVAFAGNAPGTIKPIRVDPGKEFLVQKDSFLCAENKVDMDIAFQKRLGAGFFGGEGFIIQRLFGKGLVFIHACGDFIEMDLKPGQIIKVDTGSVVGWEPSVEYDIQRAGGIKTSFFGGEGLFLTTLKGPGKIIIQSMTLHNLATALTPFLPQSGQSSGSSGISLFGQ
jgi:uncharacterized protein (TIGR00266 family)